VVLESLTQTNPRLQIEREKSEKEKAIRNAKRETIMKGEEERMKKGNQYRQELQAELAAFKQGLDDLKADTYILDTELVQNWNTGFSEPDGRGEVLKIEVSKAQKESRSTFGGMLPPLASENKDYGEDRGYDVRLRIAVRILTVSIVTPRIWIDAIVR
jgi:hypothetical protein